MDSWINFRRLIFLTTRVVKFGLFPFARFLPFPRYRLSFAVRLRRTIEELGLTYLKMGQFLALRYDILPQEVVSELDKLFESVEPMPFAVARLAIESELGGSIDGFYSWFEEKPIAAASVAQVHRARTLDGDLVAVKVQRRGLEPVFRADIRILQRFASIAEMLGIAGRLSIRGMVNQFERWTLRELDFRREGQTAERVESRAQDFVIVPHVYWGMTTRRILTMEFIQGVSVTEVRDWLDSGYLGMMERRLPGFDLQTAMRNLAFASFHQLFVTGFFHGDPHPGNIFFMPENKVAFLDFGIFGSLNREEREGVAAQIESLALGDLEGSFRYYSRQVAITEDTDYVNFRRDCMEILRRWYSALTNSRASIEDRHLARYTGEMIDVSRRNGLRYDLNYLLFWRALNNLNGTLWRVDPTFDLVAALRQFFDEIRPEEVERVRAVLRNYDWQLAVKELGREGPRRLEGALQQWSDDGRLQTIVGRSRRAEMVSRRDDRALGAALLALPLALLMMSPLHLLLRGGMAATAAVVLAWSVWRRR